MKKINILQLITGLGMGGAEKVVLDLATYISKEEFNTYVLSISNRVELLEQFLSNAINTTILNKSNSIADIINIINEVNIFVRQNNIQIIHAHMTHSVIIASIVKILNPSLKIVYTSHSFNIGSKTRELIIWMLKSFRDIDIIFSKDILKFFYKSEYKVIPNGIKVDKYNLDLSKNDKFTFIAVGRLEKMKNHKFLIEIANKLKEKYDFEIHIVGEGYLRNEIEQLIVSYNLGDCIKLLGLRTDVPVLLNKAHCLLMPSLWEGLPIVLLEAGASRLPIISTAVGSIPSLLNNENAYLVDLKQFKLSMISVMKDYEQAKNKGVKLFYTIKQKYDIKNIVLEHENIYRKLI